MLVIAFRKDIYESVNTACNCHPEYDVTQEEGELRFFVSENRQKIADECANFKMYRSNQPCYFTLVCNMFDCAEYLLSIPSDIENVGSDENGIITLIDELISDNCCVSDEQKELVKNLNELMNVKVKEIQDKREEACRIFKFEEAEKQRKLKEKQDADQKERDRLQYEALKKKFEG